VPVLLNPSYQSVRVEAGACQYLEYRMKPTFGPAPERRTALVPDGLGWRPHPVTRRSGLSRALVAYL
jgi:hypothetical protein